ncbi:Vacuolar fusion protein mon1 [Wickerhamomyces ciferrii]|uniref:Vacuolar fusion protein MON1 n=1 Tax=Wickerhamomyces ciferrii (strain ATCC 14091 / BCRC 22168 / CBS 111 / JCM 3599 / NBRC 0793 / NRRL Y-1031 F-60-10) TaxID=1206466 RepID=K0KNN4_WICCF|nr:Vacuolar fusion protein mon1 [Wickerhamomyces ciferrii]CCH46875.1 Vacuolar fusion protein mon1 [Wickerhamomyces ciferrii]
MEDDRISIDSDYIPEPGYRPQMPKRPQKKPSLSQLMVTRSKSPLKLAELQAQPTTGVSMENVGQEENELDTDRIYNTLNHYGSYHDSSNDQSTIRTTPTLTVYSEDDDLANTLGEIISQRSTDLKDNFDHEEQQEKLKGAKQFFILSAAGKPIYSMSSDADHNDDDFVNYNGIIQTIVSSFLVSGSSLKSFVTESTRFTFLNQSPIILLAISKIGESESELMNQLDLLYSFLLSALSKPHIMRSFENKEGFDLRKHLGRADLSGLNLLTKEIIDFNPGLLVGALQSIKLKKSIRDKSRSIMLNKRSKNVLYGMLVAPGGKLINVLRPKSHTLHTTDLQILFSIVFNQAKNHSEDEELWLPICFSKFNPNGFLYAFVKFVDQVALILISADRNCFFELSETSKKIIEDFKKHQIMKQINESLHHGLSTIDIPAPLIYHFIYKSKKHLQYVMPTSTNVTTLQRYYLRLYSSIDRDAKISVSFIKWDNEGKDSNSSIAGLGWVSPNYEVYLITGSITKREVLVNSAKSIVNWCKRYQERLFVCEGAVF